MISLNLVSNILGWSYVICWSLSFYPQLILNFRRKIVDGVSIDFLYLNFLGFLCLTIYNVTFLLSTVIKNEYKQRHNGKPSTVQWNDALFAIHALTFSFVGILQSFYYPRGKKTQKVSTFNGITIWVILDMIALVALFVNLNLFNLEVIDLMYFLSAIKLYVTIFKYIPQMLHNYKRKSTVGWSILNILLDFSGGILSLLQLFVDSANNHDWSGITGNPIKLSLSIVTLIFDVIFILQHYVLYKGNDEPEENDEIREFL